VKKKSVVITGLNNSFNKKVARLLCEKLEMFLLDVADLLEFELAEKDQMIATCGMDYFKQQERKVFSSLADYENTIMVIKYDHFVFDKHFNLFENAYIFYFRFQKHNISPTDVEVASLIAFEERDKFLSSLCITIDVDQDENKAAEKVIEALKKVAL
jgi:hypothetical protein